MGTVVDFKENYLKSIVKALGEKGLELYLRAIAGQVTIFDIPSNLTLEEIGILRDSGVIGVDVPQIRDYSKTVVMNLDRETKDAYALVKSLPDQFISIRLYESNLKVLSRELKKTIRTQVIKTLGSSFATMLDDEIDNELTKSFGKQSCLKQLKDIESDVFKAAQDLIAALDISSGPDNEIMNKKFDSNNALLAFGAEFKFPYWKKSVQVRDDRLTHGFITNDTTQIRNYLDESVLKNNAKKLFNNDDFRLPWAPATTVRVISKTVNEISILYKNERYRVLNVIVIGV